MLAVPRAPLMIGSLKSVPLTLDGTLYAKQIASVRNTATAANAASRPAASASAPPAPAPITSPPAHAMFVIPAAIPWCRPVASVWSEIRLVAGVKQTPAPIDAATTAATTSDSEPTRANAPIETAVIASPAT